MSEIRLVRCPKCNKVLPEPPQYAVYQCGGCGAVLGAKRSTLCDGLSEGSERLVNCEREREGEEGVGGSRAGSFDQEGEFHMASRSPARSTIGVNPPMRESALTEFDGGLPKSPMRDRFLNDLGSAPNSRTRSRDVSRSPMRERGSGDFSHDDGVSMSPARQRNFSKSPIRETKTRDRPTTWDDDDDVGVESPMRENDLTEFDGGFPKSPMRDRFLSDLGSVPNSPIRSPMREKVEGNFNFDGKGKSPVMRQRDVSQSPIRESKTPMSVRSGNVSRSPMREGRIAAGLDGVDKSPARSMVGEFPKSPMRRDNADSEFDENEEAGAKKLTVKSSFNAWLTNNENTRQPDDQYSGRRTWRDQVGSGVDEISEGRESVDDPIHGTDPRKEMLYRGRFKGEDVAGYSKSRATKYHSAPQTDGVGFFNGNKKAVLEHGRMAASSSSTAERASNYRPNSIGNHREPRHPSESLRGPASLQNLAMERAQLLQRYEELSIQLGNLDDKRVSSTEYYSGSEDYSEDGVGRFTPRSEQQFVSDRGVRRASYFSGSRSPVHNMGDVYDVHPPPYDHRFSGQMTRGPHPRNPHQFLKPSIQRRFDKDSRESYLDETHYHHPSCSCSLCYTNDWQGQDLPYSLPDRRSTNLVGNPRSSHSMNLDRYNQRHYNPRMAHTGPRERRSHLAHRHPRRGLLASPKICLPIHGGAPFILCHRCFRLLKLPRELMVKKKKKNQYQLTCGACSAVVSIDPQSKSFSPFSENKYQDSIDADSGLVKGLKEPSLEDQPDSCDATSTNIGSCDFDAVRNSFQSMDSAPSEVSKVRKLDTNLAHDLPHFSPSSSRSSKEDRVSDNASVRSSLPNSSEMPLKMGLVPPPPGSPLRDLHNHSTYFQKIQAGEVTIYTGEERQETEEDGFLESLTENRVDATEMEVHSNEVPPTSFSQDPEDLPREEDKVGNNNDAQFSVTGSMSSGSAEIYVNGQLISQHLAKKAEKFAGPIEPGEYWYDSKAGFWGAMGHRCMGIIPPSIQEFRFSMPANCSGGDTAIYVNGRELHRRDLGILEGRGLPATRNKRYMIDIYGKVIDEEAKEFVVNLGKLAPTVERTRLGFGMKVPDDLDDE